MPDDTNQGAAGSAPPVAAVADAKQEPAQPSHRDWNGLAARLHGLDQKFSTVLDAISKQAAPAVAEKKAEKSDASSSDVALAQVAELRRDLALRDAFLDNGISDAAARKLIAAAVKAENPTDVGEFVKTYAPLVKPAAAAVAPAPVVVETVKPAIPAGTSNTGPGGAEARTAIPSDILAIDSGRWQQLSPEEKRSAYERDKRAKGTEFNPFAEGKRKK